MIYDYFRYTQTDARFYEEHLRNRLPRRIHDAHTHINLPEHVRDIPPERIASDWAMQSGMQMTAQDAAFYYEKFFPDKDVTITAFPFPAKEAHIEENNDYVSDCARRGLIAYGLMCIKPEYSCEYIEREVAEKGFSGFKPYPDMVSGEKGADIGIFQFLPPEQIALIQRLRLPIVMHLPRAGRMPDENNIRELREIRQKYPDLIMIIAHFGRCYTPYHFNLALDRLGEDVKGFYFDTAAVINPEVLRIGFERLDMRRILYATDEPIFLWHGYREWTHSKYANIAREDFAWNTNHKDAQAEADYTFFVYRQLDNILGELERAGASEQIVNDIFSNNALRVFGRKDN